jgi:hypothetical protein
MIRFEEILEKLRSDNLLEIVNDPKPMISEVTEFVHPAIPYVDRIIVQAHIAVAPRIALDNRVDLQAFMDRVPLPKPHHIHQFEESDDTLEIGRMVYLQPIGRERIRISRTVTITDTYLLERIQEEEKQLQKSVGKKLHMAIIVGIYPSSALFNEAKNYPDPFSLPLNRLLTRQYSQ